MSRWADEVDEEERRASSRFTSYGAPRSSASKPNSQASDYSDFGQQQSGSRYHEENDWRERPYRHSQQPASRPGQRAYTPGEERASGSSGWRTGPAPQPTHSPDTQYPGHRALASAAHPPDANEHPLVNTSKPIKILKRQTSESQPSTPASSHASSLPDGPSSLRSPSIPSAIRTDSRPAPIPSPQEPPARDLPPGYESRPPSNHQAPQPTAQHPPAAAAPMVPVWPQAPVAPAAPAPAMAGAQPTTPTAAEVNALMAQQQQYLQMQAYMQYTLQVQQVQYQTALMQQKQYYEGLLQQMQAGGGAALPGVGVAPDASGTSPVDSSEPAVETGPPGFISRTSGTAIPDAPPADANPADGPEDSPDSAPARKVKQGFQTYAPPTTRTSDPPTPSAVLLGGSPPPGGLPAPASQGAANPTPASRPLFMPAADKQAGVGGGGGSGGRAGGGKSRFQYNEDDNPWSIVASMHEEAAEAAALAAVGGVSRPLGLLGGPDKGRPPPGEPEQGRHGEAEWGGRGGQGPRAQNRGRELGQGPQAAAVVAAAATAGPSGSRSFEHPTRSPPSGGFNRQAAPPRSKNQPPPSPTSSDHLPARPPRIRTSNSSDTALEYGVSTPPPGGFRKASGSQPAPQRQGKSNTTPRTTPRPPGTLDSGAAAFAAAALRAALPPTAAPDAPARGASVPPSPAQRGPSPARTPPANTARTSSPSNRRRPSRRRSASPAPPPNGALAAGPNSRPGSAAGRGAEGKGKEGPPGFAGSQRADAGQGAEAEALGSPGPMAGEGDGASASGGGRRPRGRPPRVLYAPPRKASGVDAGGQEPVAS